MSGEQLDQNPRVVTGQDVQFNCPVLGIEEPTIEWRRDGVAIGADDNARITIEHNGQVLRVAQAVSDDAARYTCHASNKAGTLDTDYALKVIGPPKFGTGSISEYEVAEMEQITMTCDVHVRDCCDVGSIAE